MKADARADNSSLAWYMHLFMVVKRPIYGFLQAQFIYFFLLPVYRFYVSETNIKTHNI